MVRRFDCDVLLPKGYYLFYLVWFLSKFETKNIRFRFVVLRDGLMRSAIFARRWWTSYVSIINWLNLICDFIDLTFFFLDLARSIVARYRCESSFYFDFNFFENKTLTFPCRLIRFVFPNDFLFLFFKKIQIACQSKRLKCRLITTWLLPIRCSIVSWFAKANKYISIYLIRIRFDW